MIRAETSGLRAWAWRRYIDWRLRRDFGTLLVRGPMLPRGEPLLCYANHSSWWDGFLFLALCRAAGRAAYCVMEEQHLAKHRFLRRLGAFSLVRGDAASALESLRYARSLLRQPDATVVIFPQGRLLPAAQPPLELERGVEVLARAAQVRCVPLAMRLGFFGGERPEALLELGAAHAPGPLATFQERLDTVVRSVNSASPNDGFSRLGAPRALGPGAPVSDLSGVTTAGHR